MGRLGWVRRVGRIASMTALVVVIFAIVTHWPMAFGGSTQLVWVSGDSMEPTYRAHDLVVVRAGDDYDVGDVVMYPIPDGQAGEGVFVIHRIVAVFDGGVGAGRDDTVRYVTRGDNRTSDDPWAPTADDIVGAVAHTVAFGPISATWVMVALSPIVVAMVLGALAAALVWSWLSPPPRGGPVTDPDAGAWPAPQPRCANSPTVSAGSPTHDSSPSIRPDAPGRRSHGW